MPGSHAAPPLPAIVIQGSSAGGLADDWKQVLTIGEPPCVEMRRKWPGMVMLRDMARLSGFMASHLAMNPSTGQYGHAAQAFLSLLLAGAAAQRVKKAAADGRSGN